MFYRIRISTGGGFYINLDKVFTSTESARAEVERERRRGALLAPVAIVQCIRQRYETIEEIIDIF